jgi:APA family basic amino acid/polyamine antiporter
VAASSLRRRKTIEEAMASTEVEESKLKRELGASDVVVFGIGVIIGAGIFVLTGQAAATEAGPAITLSFVVAAIVCGLAGLCYAEFASMVPVAGSAYTFSYVTLGELIAFMIGWDLVLEFTLGAATVAVGWAGYIDALLDQLFGVTLPKEISAPPGEGGVVNVFAVLLVAVLAAVLVAGIKLSSRVNIIITVVTILSLLIVIAAGAPEVDASNWSPYFPFGVVGGVLGGAALVFFAFIGFDIVATAAEETREPQRDMPRGILGSLAITTLLYVAVSAVITGIVALAVLNSDSPIADAFERLDQPFVVAAVFAGAIVATTNTTLILMLGQTRVAFAMARDRLLPSGLSRTHRGLGTPVRLTLVTAVAVGVLSAFVPLTVLAELVNIGTLFAFILVAAGVLFLRRRDPDRERPFRVPLVPVVPLLAIAGCIALIASLDATTVLRFLVWLVVGLVVYAAYSRRRSALAGRS